MAFIVGIGGVTNGGKTTVARKLLKQLPHASCLNQDDYFWTLKCDVNFWTEKGLWLPQLDFPKWDCEEALDIDRLVNHIKEWKKSCQCEVDRDRPQILLDDGFLLYTHKELCSLFDKKFFLLLPYEECKKRRMRRTYFPPGPVEYFDVVAWPAHLKFKSEVADQDDIVYVSGTNEPDTVFNIIYNEIRRMYGR